MMKPNLFVAVLQMLVIPSIIAADVDLLRLPDGALQPMAATDAQGAVHLVWLQGEPKACDVYYQRLPGGRPPGSAPVRVNRTPGNAIAIGTIRGAQIAIGRSGRVHIVWNGSSTPGHNSSSGAPLLYSRLDESGNGFEPERNLMGRTSLLDGGASVAADRSGGVYVLWHASPGAGLNDESNRRVFLARSADDGRTFQAEVPISLADGVCSCCSLRAVTDRDGSLFVLYRSARSMTERPITLLASIDRGMTFSQIVTDPWIVGACPMSSGSLLDGPNGVLAAWETNARIRTMVVQPQSQKPGSATPASMGDRARHPALAINARGETLCAWAEGTGWQKGGRVDWCLLDASGRPVGEIASHPGLPVWSYPAAWVTGDSRFVIAF